MASGKVDGHSVERGPSHVSVVPLEVAVQFLVAYYLTSFYPKTSFLYAIWLLKVAQVYVLKTSSSASSAKMSQANGKEIDAEALNSTDESNFKNKSCFLVDIGETNCCSGVKTDTEKINKREIASKSKFLLEVPSKFLNSTKSRSGSAPTILEIRTALEELGCIKCIDIEERNKDSVADATKMKGFDFKMFCVGQVQVGCNADEEVDKENKSQRKELNIPLQDEPNNLNTRTVGHRKRKKKKKLNVTLPAKSEANLENETKKPKEHDWEELGHNNEEVSPNVEEIVDDYQLSVMGTSQSGWDVGCSHCSITQGSERVRNGTPADGNNKNGMTGEGREKGSSSNSCTVANKQGRSCQVTTGSPSVSGSGGSDGEDEDDRDREPKPLSTCSKDVCLNLDEEEESESEQTGVDVTVENLFIAGKGELSVAAGLSDTCQNVASEVSPECSSAASCQSLQRKLENIVTKPSYENQDESESDQRNTAGESLYDQCSLEEDNAVALSAGLKSAFQCRRNLCSDAAWAACEDKQCQDLSLMMTHSNKCEQRRLGSCQLCTTYSQLLYYHASKCGDVECTVSRCDYIKMHIAELQALPDGQWSRKLDQLFFSSLPPQSPSTPIIPADVSTLFPDACTAISGSEALQDAHSYLFSAQRNKIMGMHPGTSRHGPGMMYEQLLSDLPMSNQAGGVSSSKVGSSNYLHDFSVEPDVQDEWSACHVDRPPDLPLPDLAHSTRSSSVETGVEYDVEFTVNSKINNSSCHIPLIEASSNTNNINTDKNQGIDLLRRSCDSSEYKNAAGQQTQGIQESQQEQTAFPKPYLEAEAAPLSCRDSSSFPVKQPIAVKEITVQCSEKLEYDVPVGLAYQTENNHGADEILWPLDQDHLSVVDGHYDEDVHWFSSNDWHLGGGANGRCYIGTDHRTGVNFAIKRIPVEKFEMSELDIWGKLSGGPNILELYGAVRKGKYVIIFMEFMEGRSVEDVLADQEDVGYGGSESSSDDLAQASGFPQEQAMHIMREVIEGVKFMHSLKIMHRDLKGGNILLDATGQKVRIADFGEAIQLDERESQQDNAPRGTEAFMAPEVCRSESHSFSADIWSLMCTLYQMLVGQPPWMKFRHGSILFQIAMAASPPELPPCSAVVQDFFKQGFKLNAHERATAVALLRHPALELGTAVVGGALVGRSDSLGYSTEQELDDLISSDVERFVGEIPSDGEDFLQSQSDDSILSTEAIEAIALASKLLRNENETGQEMPKMGDLPSFTGSEGSVSSSEAMALVREILQSDERVHSNSALPVEDELNQLSSGHLSSVPWENWNGDDLLSDSEDDAFEREGAMVSGSTLHPQASRQNSYFSMTALTKVHILGPDGNLICPIRESATQSYGELAQMLHSMVVTMAGLENFTLVQSSGALLDPSAELGSQEQWLRVLPAAEADNWRAWRVDQHGVIEHK